VILFFWDRVLRTSSLGCFQTMILISVSWVARIPGVSHQSLALAPPFLKTLFRKENFCYLFKFFLFLFLIFLNHQIVVVSGAHCDIYKSTYNTSWLNPPCYL
jgi:hypothetical protein